MSGQTLGLTYLLSSFYRWHSGWDVKLTAYPYLMPRLRMSRAKPSLPICLHDVYKDSFTFTSACSILRQGSVALFLLILLWLACEWNKKYSGLKSFLGYSGT